MRKLICIIFLISTHLLLGQKECFEKANAYRSDYLNNTHISFDTLTHHLKKGEQMLLHCTFPNDTFTTAKGSHLSIDKYKGKIRIINFWSIHCPPCINEIPSFHSLQKKYKKDLVVLAFTLDSQKEIIHYLQKKTFNAEITADARDFVEKYSLGSGYPFTIVVDKAGKIIYVKSGGNAEPEHQSDLYYELAPVIDASLKHP